MSSYRRYLAAGSVVLVLAAATGVTLASGGDQRSARDETVTVQNGRYGPYVKKGTDSRSLDSEDQLFTLGLAEAKEIFAQPKTDVTEGRRPRAASR